MDSQTPWLLPVINMDSEWITPIFALCVGVFCLVVLFYYNRKEWDRVYFSAPALRKIITIQNALPNKEIGGLLFGESSFGYYYVRDITTLENMSNISHKAYIPDSREAMAQLQVARSNGWQLLGDWHSHPKNAPILSPEDIDSAKKKREVWGSNYVVMILAPSGIGAWVVRRKAIRRQ